MQKLLYMSVLVCCRLILKCTCDTRSGLVGWWRFNGDASDSSGNGYDGTVTDATLTSDRFGDSNSAYLFDGGADYISISPYSSLELSTSSISISAWIKTSATDSNGRIFSKGSAGCITGYMVRTTNNNANVLLEMSSSDTCVLALSGSVTINDGSWHHIVMIADYGSMAYIYVDNALDTSLTFTTNYNVGNSRQPYIGVNDVGLASEYFDGTMDDIRVYSRALSTDDIDELYNLSPTQAPTVIPTKLPSTHPSNNPSSNPSTNPSNNPTNNPTNNPSVIPSSMPSRLPSSIATNIPSHVPSMMPSNNPSNFPSNVPFSVPSSVPSNAPSNVPSRLPTVEPSSSSITSTRNSNAGETSNTGNSNSDDIEQLIINFGIILGVLLFLCLCIIVAIIVGCFLYQKKTKQDIMNHISKNNQLGVNEGGITVQMSNTSAQSAQSQKSVEAPFGTASSNLINTNDTVGTGLAMEIINSNYNSNRKHSDGMPEIEDILANVDKIELPQAPGMVNMNGMDMEGGEGNAYVNGGGYGGNTNGPNPNEINMDEDDNDDDNGVNDNTNNGLSIENLKQINIDNNVINDTSPSNWQSWNDKQVIIWLQKVLMAQRYSKENVNDFLTKFAQVNVTGRLLDSWLQNKTKNEILNELQSRVEFNKKSYIWDATIQSIMQLSN